MKEQDEDLFGELKNYAASDVYPFHMPGHKRRSGWVIDPYAIDITEVEGFDNLHHPTGRLKRSMERAAGIYGADNTYYLINGSTCGIMAAIGAAVPFGGKLLLSRNAHKSAYNAVAADHLKTVMTYPQKVDKLGIFGGIKPETVDNLLTSNPDAAAILLVSPTYDGVISDIAVIAQTAHEHGVPLIVDEAHGAHLKFTSDYRSAIDQGADIVVQSLHKTLPALTQTALLHVKGDRIDIAKLEHQLQMYQSSSPSYILLGSIEACISESAAHAPAEWDAHYGRVAKFRQEMKDLSAISLPGRNELRGIGSIYDYDDSRLLISVKDCIIRDESGDMHPASGRWLSSRLRKKYHLEMEMAAESYVLAITTPFDTDEAFARLAAALRDTDKELMRIREPVRRRRPNDEAYLTTPPSAPEAFMTIADALDAGSIAIPAEESEGRIAAEFAYLYPPGIPLIVPGERISENVLRTLREWRETGFLPEGMADETAETIRVIKD